MEIITTGSMHSIVSQAEAIQAKCSDYSVSVVGEKNFRFDPHTCGIVYLPDSQNESRSAVLTAHSMGQLCNKLSVPSTYIDRCLKEGLLDLASDNVNSWLADFGKSMLVREYDGTVRGILSDRYMVLDTPDILNSIAEVVNPDEYAPKGFYLSSERFHARLIGKTRMKIQGEDLYPGIMIDSSDVGRSVLSVRFMIFKQVCTNGLIVSKNVTPLFEQKHIGVSIDIFNARFQESLVKIPEYIHTYEEVVTEAIETPFQYDLSKVLSDPESPTAKAYYDSLRFSPARVSEDHAKLIAETMATTYTPNVWGFVNSITQVAQKFSLERRIELESFAGDLLAA